MNTIACVTMSTCPHCGLTRERLPRKGVAVIDEFMKEHYGESLHDVAREPRMTRSGNMTWAHGGGYAVVDEDLLGGDGTGRRENELNRAGIYVRGSSGNGRVEVCANCRKWL